MACIIASNTSPEPEKLNVSDTNGFRKFPILFLSSFVVVYNGNDNDSLFQESVLFLKSFQLFQIRLSPMS